MKRTDDPASPWYARVIAAVHAHLWLKAIGTPMFIAIFFGAYFYLLKYPAHPVTVMPTVWLDRVIDFEPRALPVYLSLWVYVSLAPALLVTRRELSRYTVWIALTCLIGLAFFYFWPTAVPSPEIDWTQYPEVHFLKNMDAAGNAFPSLHVATAVFSGYWLHHLLRRLRSPRWLLAVNALWGAGIIYSTMATRQHVAIDVLGGLLLGGACAYLSLRKRAATPGALLK